MEFPVIVGVNQAYGNLYQSKRSPFISTIPAPLRRESGRYPTHSIHASGNAPTESLRQYLESKNSPLAPQSDVLLRSDYWSTIIAICTVEERSCTTNPLVWDEKIKQYVYSNNFWGIGGGSHLRQFASIPSALDYMDHYLRAAEAGGHPTVESFNCWYVQPCSETWVPGVLQTKIRVEALSDEISQTPQQQRVEAATAGQASIIYPAPGQ